MTDYLVRRQSASIVGRFNGGAQASHTVVAGGRRHAFSHVGAGTMAGAETWLSSDFVINPFHLQEELAKLQASGIAAFPISASRRAPVTTMFDMAMNMAIELLRGEGRHGSCGLGINETVTRHANPQFQLRLDDVKLMSVATLAAELEQIHREWVPERLRHLGLDDLTDDEHAAVGNMLHPNSQNATTYQSQARGLLDALQHLHVGIRQPHTCEHVVLEGAQGLGLDAELGNFPHVTRSLTGLPQAIVAAHEIISGRVPVYVTRAYVTRHGAGPLLHEGEPFTTKQIIDLTNVPNQFQGTMRYAPLDLQVLKRNIEADLARAPQLLDRQFSGLSIGRPVLALTCLDQLDATVPIYDKFGHRRVVCLEDLVLFIEEQVEVRVQFMSYGPSATDVIERKGLYDVAPPKHV
jgi:adenylosuccinate synthase